MDGCGGCIMCVSVNAWICMSSCLRACARSRGFVCLSDHLPAFVECACVSECKKHINRRSIHICVSMCLFVYIYIKKRNRV